MRVMYGTWALLWNATGVIDFGSQKQKVTQSQRQQFPPAYSRIPTLSNADYITLAAQELLQSIRNAKNFNNIVLGQTH